MEPGILAREGRHPLITVVLVTGSGAGLVFPFFFATPTFFLIPAGVALFADAACGGAGLPRGAFFALLMGVVAAFSTGPV
jgi:hypothetical protein